jgi:hypothetical protein
MQPTRNAPSENIRAQSVEFLNKRLAAAIDLTPRRSRRIGTCVGVAIHDLFDKISAEVQNYSDLMPSAAAPRTASFRWRRRNPSSCSPVTDPN